MSNLLEDLGSLFSFLTDQLGSFANFFTSNLLGQIILGIVLFGTLSSLLMYIINRVK